MISSIAISTGTETSIDINISTDTSIELLTNIIDDNSGMKYLPEAGTIL